MGPQHSLLIRQLKRHLGGVNPIPKEWQEFVRVVDDAYRQFDEDRGMLERSLELSSQELLRANADMRAVFQAFPDIYFRIDACGTILDYRGGIATDLYPSLEKLLGTKIQEIPFGKVETKFLDAIRLVGERKSLVSIEYSLTSQQREYFYEARLVPLLENQIIVIVRNITDRKRLEEALRESEQRLNLSLASAQMGMWDLDLVKDTTIRSIEHDRIFGYQTLQPEWGSQIFFNHVIPEDHEQVRKRFEVAFQTGDFSMECRIIWPDKSIHWIAEQGRVFRNDKGDPIKMMGVVTEITERKRAEEEVKRLNEALAQHAIQLETANKELEAFSYSVSHDLRAPLRHMDGFAELLQENSVQLLDERNRRYLTIIQESAKQMGQLIDDLLVFSRMGRAEMLNSSVNLDQLVQDVILRLKPDTEGRDIVWQVSPLPNVAGDPSMLQLVFMNLISNALKYTRTRSQVRIEIGHYNEPTGELVVFVRDNGVGFDMHYKDKLFGVFQRLHKVEEFEGTGIGLANVRRIIQRHGGRTWAEGKVDEGATFYFSLLTQKEGNNERVKAHSIS